MSMEELQLNQLDFQDIAATILHRGNSFCFKAHGFSMTPFIRDGDIVYLKRFPVYIVGDVVLSKIDQGVLLHRIVRKTNAGYITRGDAACSEDQVAVPADILGKVYRLIGQGYNFHLRRPYSYLLTTSFVSNCMVRSRLIRKAGKILAGRLE